MIQFEQGYWAGRRSSRLRHLQKDVLPCALEWTFPNPSWTHGGCYIYARGLQLYGESLGIPITLIGAYDTWEEDQFWHVYASDGQYCYDAKTLDRSEYILAPYQQEGACALRPITANEAQASRIPIHDALSLSIAVCFAQELEYLVLKLQGKRS